MNNKHFSQALSDFTFDAACGGAIRHLADNGYTVNEIKERLDYPTSLDNIRNCVFKHFQDKKLILTEDPAFTSGAGVIYEKVYDSFGHASFIQRAKSGMLDSSDYIKFDSRDALISYLSGTAAANSRQLLELPWPEGPIWLHK